MTSRLDLIKCAKILSDACGERGGCDNCPFKDPDYYAEGCILVEEFPYSWDLSFVATEEEGN